MRKTGFISAFLLLLLISPQAMAAPAGDTADVTVTIPNIESAKGVVRVFICKPAEFLGNSCAYKKALPAQTGKMDFVIKKVPAGTYAIEAYQDENDDGKIDFGFLGIYPEEGYGFSRLGRIYSEPSFDDAAVEIDPPKASFQIALHYP